MYVTYINNYQSRGDSVAVEKPLDWSQKKIHTSNDDPRKQRWKLQLLVTHS